MRVRGLVGPLLAMLIPYLVFEALRQGYIHDGHYNMPQGHFYIVSFVAILATIIAITVGIVGSRLRNIQVSTGYPDQLKGTKIPLLARIVAVVDVYDALTSHRSYRRAWPHHDVMELLKDGKNSHFDEQCVDAWVRICEREPAIIEQYNNLEND